jgi:hypothetical protein
VAHLREGLDAPRMTFRVHLPTPDRELVDAAIQAAGPCALPALSVLASAVGETIARRADPRLREVLLAACARSMMEAAVLHGVPQGTS